VAGKKLPMTFLFNSKGRLQKSFLGFFPNYSPLARTVFAFLISVFLIYCLASTTFRVYKYNKNEKICNIFGIFNPCSIDISYYKNNISDDQIKKLISGKDIEYPACVVDFIILIIPTQCGRSSEFYGEEFLENGDWKGTSKGFAIIGRSGKWRIQNKNIKIQIYDFNNENKELIDELHRPIFYYKDNLFLYFEREEKFVQIHLEKYRSYGSYNDRVKVSEIE
jgi:hypothetical protein